MSYYVYVLRNAQNKLYIGQAQSLDQRLKDHVYQEIKYTKDHGSDFQLVYSEQYPTRAEAMRRERQLKSWTRAKKEALIAGDLKLLKTL